MALHNELSQEALAWAKVEHVVYFLHAPDCGLVKIGYSFELWRRVAEIQLLSPARLEILGAMPGGLRKESELHRRFAHLRSHGEWFHLDDELDRFIGVVALSRRFSRLPDEMKSSVARILSEACGQPIDIEAARLSVEADLGRPLVHST